MNPMKIDILINPRSDHAMIHPDADAHIRAYVMRTLPRTVDHTVIIELATNRVIITAHHDPMTISALTDMPTIIQSNARAMHRAYAV